MWCKSLIAISLLWIQSWWALCDLLVPITPQFLIVSIAEHHNGELLEEQKH